MLGLRWFSLAVGDLFVEEIAGRLRSRGGLAAFGCIAEVADVLERDLEHTLLVSQALRTIVWAMAGSTSPDGVQGEEAESLISSTVYPQRSQPSSL